MDVFGFLYGQHDILIQTPGNMSLSVIIEGANSEILIDDMRRVTQGDGTSISRDSEGKGIEGKVDGKRKDNKTIRRPNWPRSITNEIFFLEGSKMEYAFIFVISSIFSRLEIQFTYS